MMCFRIADINGKKAIDVSTSDKITTMLEKQKTHALAKGKNGKMGKELMKELHLKSAAEYKGLQIPLKPPRITGYIFKIGKVLGGKNRRYFEMNPIEGNLIKYMRKEDCPKNPKEIYCIADITGFIRLPATGVQKFHFFEVFVILFTYLSYSSSITNGNTSFAAAQKKQPTFGSSTSTVQFHTALS